MIIRIKRYNMVLLVKECERIGNKTRFYGKRLNQNILFDKKTDIKYYQSDLLNKNQYICIG